MCFLKCSFKAGSLTEIDSRSWICSSVRLITSSGIFKAVGMLGAARPGRYNPDDLTWSGGQILYPFWGHLWTTFFFPKLWVMVCVLWDLWYMEIKIECFSDIQPQKAKKNAHWQNHLTNMVPRKTPGIHKNDPN